MVKKIDLSLVLPCFNEAEHFAQSVQLIDETLKKMKISYEIIFIEDGSTDETRSLLERFLVNKRGNKNYSIIQHKKNYGRGKSVVDGLLAARGIFVGYMDIDCEISPRYIAKAYSMLLEGVEVVYADREYAITRKGLLRAIASTAYLYLVKWLLSTSVRDTESGFKFFNRERIVKIAPMTSDSGWFWDTEVMVMCESAGLDIQPLKVVFMRRNDKTSTVKLLPDTMRYVQKLLEFKKKQLLNEK